MHPIPSLGDLPEIPNLPELLKPFHEMLGEVDNAEIADMLSEHGVTADHVAAYIALRAQEDAEQQAEPDAAPDAPGEDFHDTIPPGVGEVSGEEIEEPTTTEPAPATDPSTIVERSPEEEAKERTAKEAEAAAMQADPAVQARREAMSHLYSALTTGAERLYYSTTAQEAEEAWAALQAVMAGDVPAAFLPAAAAVSAAREATAAPRCVRAVKTATLRGPDGKLLKLRRRDVLKGKVAAWLWANHRKLVESYPRPKS